MEKLVNGKSRKICISIPSLNQSFAYEKIESIAIRRTTKLWGLMYYQINNANVIEGYHFYHLPIYLSDLHEPLQV